MMKVVFKGKQNEQTRKFSNGYNLQWSVKFF